MAVRPRCSARHPWTGSFIAPCRGHVPARGRAAGGTGVSPAVAPRTPARGRTAAATAAAAASAALVAVAQTRARRSAAAAAVAAPAGAAAAVAAAAPSGPERVRPLQLRGRHPTRACAGLAISLVQLNVGGPGRVGMLTNWPLMFDDMPAHLRRTAVFFLS
jgi:hypothetical protein